MAITDIQVCNRILQRLGAKRIVSLSDDNANARALSDAYPIIKRAELRKHNWNCAIERHTIAADGTAPAWGRANSFALPSGFLKLCSPYPEWNYNSRDWVIESGKILTYESGPLYVRCVMDIDAAQMDALLVEVISAAGAYELCEVITQSNSKKQAAKQDYEDAVKAARRANAFENVPVMSFTDAWVTGRNL